MQSVHRRLLLLSHGMVLCSAAHARQLHAQPGWIRNCPAVGCSHRVSGAPCASMFTAADGAGGGGASSSDAEPEAVPFDRKAQKKATKAAKRARREGTAPTEHGQKLCHLCSKSVDLLIRCRIDETREWRMVCGKCWKGVSGGVTDGDKDHPHYQYGGLWKKR